jgi:hypothetical protein
MDKDETIEAAENLVSNGNKDALILWKDTLPTAARDPGGTH